jgi:hypothetical protein
VGRSRSMDRVPSQRMEHELLKPPSTYVRDREAYLHAIASANRLPLSQRTIVRRLERCLHPSSTMQPILVLGDASKATEQSINVVTPIVSYGSAYATIKMLSCKKARPERHRVVAGVHHCSQSGHQGALGAINVLSRHDNLSSVPRSFGSILSTHVA